MFELAFLVGDVTGKALKNSARVWAGLTFVVRLLYPNVDANCPFRPSIDTYDGRWAARLANKHYTGLLYIPMTEYLKRGNKIFCLTRSREFMTTWLANRFSTKNLFKRFSTVWRLTGMARYCGTQERYLKYWGPPGLWLKPSKGTVEEAATGDCAAKGWAFFSSPP